jgi:serine/threonine protein kinase
MAYKLIPKYSVLTIDTSTSYEDASIIQKQVLKKFCFNHFPDYEIFRPYLKHLYDAEITPKSLQRIKYKVSELYRKVREHIKYPIHNQMEKPFLRSILTNKRPFCTNNKEKGLTVKLFKIDKISDFMKLTKPLVLKVYLFENKIYEQDSDVSFMYADMFKSNIVSEIVFQEYAEKIQRKENLDFIVPTICDYGEFDYNDSSQGSLKLKCYYLLMEYIEGITLKEALFNKSIFYESALQKVKEIDIVFKCNLLHHNDLNRTNIILTPDHKVAIIDYGEASPGPHQQIE